MVPKGAKLRYKEGRTTDPKTGKTTCHVQYAGKVHLFTKNRVMTLPRWTNIDTWTNDKKAIAEAKAVWDRVINTALRDKHEKGHFDIFDTYDITKTITARGDADTMKEAAKLALSDWYARRDKLIDDRWADVKSKQEKYDKDTKNGATQGAVWEAELINYPPPLEKH